MSDTEFKILVVGKAGAGKSALIKALVQKSADTSEDGVKGHVTPTRPLCFPLPDSKVTLWECPGFGTQALPEDNDFFSRVDFSSYHFYVIVSCSKVNEFEVKVIQRIAREGKGYVYVRTKMDQALRSEQRAHPRTFDEALTLQKVRDSVGRALPGARVFLVDCHHQGAADLPRLKEEVLRAPDTPRPEPAVLGEEEDAEGGGDVKKGCGSPATDSDEDGGESQAEGWFEWAENLCALL